MPQSTAPAPTRSIRARTTVAVERDAVLRTLRCEPPLTVRRVHGPRGECALCLVGTAAGPLPGDDLALLLDIGPDAQASLSAAGASLALGPIGGTALGPARIATAATIAPGGALRAQPPPLILAAGSWVEASVSIRLAAGASVQWQEMVVLGRSGEPGGRLRLRWDVSCDGLPLLRQVIDLADRALAGWPVMLQRGAVLASALVVGPQVAARTIVASQRAVAARLADDAVLVTVLDDNAHDAQSAVNDLLMRVRS